LPAGSLVQVEIIVSRAYEAIETLMNVKKNPQIMRISFLAAVISRY
jgi:hypothetical protein